MRTTSLLGVALLAVASAAGVADAGETKTVNVNCGTGETIQAALDAHAKPGRALTVNIKGTCTENVVVTADDTTLRGDPTATVTSTDPAQNTILVNGASRCTIENLTVSGARNGIAAINAGSLAVQNVEAKDNVQSGVVSFAGSRVNVNASTLHDNGIAGFVVTDNGAGFLTNSTVENNASSGVIVQRASSARIGQDSSGANGPNTIQNNGNHGVFVYQSAQALVHGNTITGNGGAGVLIESAAGTVTGNTIQSSGTYGVSMSNNAGGRIGLTDQSVAAGNTISGSGLDGVGLFNGSNAFVHGNTISGNARDGVSISRSAGRLVGGNTISGNGVRGVSVSGGQLLQSIGDFAIPFTADVIQGNANDGLGVFQGGSAEVNRASITGNGFRGITLSNSASLRILNSTISGNANDGIGVFNGSSLLINAPTVTVTGNGAIGINLFDGASADVQFASITLNGGRGVTASTGSKIRLQGTTVSQHPNDGVGVFDGSTALLQCLLTFPNCAPGSVNTITQNTFNGVNVATGSTGILQGVTISNTNGVGVRVDTNSTLRVQLPTTQVINNTAAGINVSHASAVNFNSPPAVVANNDGLGSFQVNCFGAPSVVITNGGSGTTGIGPGGISPACQVFP